MMIFEAVDGESLELLAPLQTWDVPYFSMSDRARADIAVVDFKKWPSGLHTAITAGNPDGGMNHINLCIKEDSCPTLGTLDFSQLDMDTNGTFLLTTEKVVSTDVMCIFDDPMTQMLSNCGLQILVHPELSISKEFHDTVICDLFADPTNEDFFVTLYNQTVYDWTFAVAADPGHGEVLWAGPLPTGDNDHYGDSTMAASDPLAWHSAPNPTPNRPTNVPFPEYECF